MAIATPDYGRIVPAKSESPWLDPQIARYVSERAAPPDEVLSDLAAETVAEAGDWSMMQIAPDQGALMGLLARLIGARTAIELGTFTGYSAICLARALGPEGRLVCCDVSERWTAIAQRAWERAGVADRIDLHLGPALDTLRSLPADAQFDLGFIDADKESYIDYYEELVPRIRPGGLLLIDNTLWFGRVADPNATDDTTLILRRVNDHVAADERVESHILPIADGLTVVRVR